MTKTENADTADPRGLRFGPGEAWASGSAFSYALANVFSSVAVVAADPLVASAFRLLPTLAIAWLQVGRARLWSRLSPASASFLGWRLLAILFLTGAGGSAGTVAFFFALHVGGVVLAAPILSTNVLWSALIAALFLKEPLNFRMTMGILVSVLGIALLGYGRSVGSAVLPGALWAIPLTLGASISWSAMSNCSRYVLRRGINKYLVLATSQTFGVLIMVGLVFVVGRGVLLWTTPVDALGLVLMAGVLTAFAQVCDTSALSLTTVASYSTIYGTNSLISAFIAVLFLGESLSFWMVAGTIATVAGAIYVQLSRPLLASS